MSPGPVGKLKKYVDVSGFQAIPSPATVPYVCNNHRASQGQLVTGALVVVEAFLRCSNLDAAIQYLQEAKGPKGVC